MRVVAARRHRSLFADVPGLLTCLICEAVTVVIAVSMMAYFHYANRRADRTGKLIEGHPTFRCASAAASLAR